MLDADDVLVSRGGDKEIGTVHIVLDACHLVTVHRGLKRTDRIHLGYDNAGALTPQRLRCTLAHISITADERHLAPDEDVGGAVEAVWQGVTDAVSVVEL